MIGVILIGGQATRLKPISNFIPKALFPFMNKPILCHQIEMLIEAEVSEIILACGVKHEYIADYVKSLNYNINITIIVEDTPQGTEGALFNAVDQRGLDEGIFVMNGDIVCDLKLRDLIGEVSTIALTKVSHPENYGVVVLDAANYITSFIEKPKHFISPYINAGIYFLTPFALKKLKRGFSMLERDLFPDLAQSTRLCGLVFDGFWSDLGTPEAILDATLMKSDSISNNDRHAQNTIIYSSISPHSVIENCCLTNVVVLDGVVLRNVTAERCIISRNCTLTDCEIYNSIFADGATGDRIICKGVIPANK